MTSEIKNSDDWEKNATKNDKTTLHTRNFPKFSIINIDKYDIIDRKIGNFEKRN